MTIKVILFQLLLELNSPDIQGVIFLYMGFKKYLADIRRCWYRLFSWLYLKSRCF